jgi:hypothetical protein
MQHVPSPVLRRLADEPLAVPDRALRHLDVCDRCQARRRRIADDATVAATLLCAPDLSSDIDLEWIALQDVLAEPGPVTRPARRDPWRMPRRLIPAGVGAGTAVAAGVLVAGVGAAAALTTIYAPTRVAPLRVSAGDVRAIASITSFGTTQLSAGLPQSGSLQLAFGEVTWTSTGRAEQVSSIASARAVTHLPFPAPAQLPAGVGSPASIEVQPQVTATVHFNKSAGPAVGGSILEITGGPAMVVQYGGRSSRGGVTTLAVAAVRRPVASSTGATASQLESFLLSRGGLPAGLVRELRLLGNPGPVLPVPVPSGVSSETVRIGGAAGVLVADPSGAASGVIWESPDGVVHGVGGLLDKEDVLSVARQIG